MNRALSEKIKIPEGITCTYAGGVLSCKKGNVEAKRRIAIPKTEIKIKDNSIILESEKGNKNQYKRIMSNIAHIKNIFKGLNKKFTYNLEVCHVHFPVSLKVENNKVSITNFFGEKTPRYAKILDNVDVEIKGQKITVSSHDKESAGQTAANLERATTLRGRDRRIYQDGIFIVSKPGEEGNE